MSGIWNRMSKEETYRFREAAKRGIANSLNFLDKERYERELKALDSLSSTLHKPKKCLSAYMIFV
jgi:hypothetical protein